MTTLVLLHGAWHGAWCWRPLQSELDRRGVTSIALDLPAGEPDADAARYAEVVADRVESVLIPHSLAGVYAPLVAERIGARGIVNLAALTPEPGVSARQQGRDLPGIYTEPYRTASMVRHDDGSTSVPEGVARNLLFHDLPDAEAAIAFTHLRPQFWTVWSEPCPLGTWPDVAYAHVGCSADRVLGAEGIIDGAARTKADLTWIDSGHLPMLSHPVDTANALLAAIARW